MNVRMVVWHNGLPGLRHQVRGKGKTGRPADREIHVLLCVPQRQTQKQEVHAP